MTSTTVTRLYDNYSDAVTAVHALEAAGISADNISLVAKNADDRVVTREEGNEATPGAEIGAGVGAVAGGGAGLLAGLGMLAIPGVGPVVAAGWLVALAVGVAGGAAAGGVTGGLIGSGISKEHAEVYAEGLRRGGSLVSVRTTEDDAGRVDAILNTNAIDPVTRRKEFVNSGWTGHDPDIEI